MARVDTAAHQDHVQLQDILPGTAVALHPSILPAQAAEALEHTVRLEAVRDTHTDQEAPAAVVRRARELGRRIDLGEAACGHSTVDQAGTDAGNRRRLLRWEDDRTGRNHTTHRVGLTGAARAPGSCTGPAAGHRGLPWRRDLASAPGTTENPRPFRGRLHRGRSSKRTSRLHRGCVRLPSGPAGLYGSCRS